jgi:hypothetical protein
MSLSDREGVEGFRGVLRGCVRCGWDREGVEGFRGVLRGCVRCGWDREGVEGFRGTVSGGYLRVRTSERPGALLTATVTVSPDFPTRIRHQTHRP